MSVSEAKARHREIERRFRWIEAEYLASVRRNLKPVEGRDVARAQQDALESVPKDLAGRYFDAKRDFADSQHAIDAAALEDQS